MIKRHVKFILLVMAALYLTVFVLANVQEPARKISNLSFRDKNLKAVFQALSVFENINIFFDEQVRDSKVSININNMTFDQALELLLKTHKLFLIRTDPQTIIIIPDTPEKREQYKEMAIKTFYIVNAEAKDIMNLLRTMIGARQIFVNERLNALVIRDSKENMTLVEQLIRDNDKLARQVDIELELFEVNRERIKKLGAQFSKDTLTLKIDKDSLDLEELAKVDPNNLITTLPGLIYSVMKESSDSVILANPKVRITNRQKAKIVIADRIPLEISTSTFTPEGSETVTTTIQYKDVGIQFNVEPTIHLNGKTTIKLNIEVSSIVGESSEGYPTIRTRNVETFIRLNDRETKILGGLISDSERTSIKKIPLLGDVPYLGALFRSEDTRKIQTEIVMAITPKIIAETETDAVSSSEAIILGQRGTGPVGAAPNRQTSSPAKQITSQPAQSEPAAGGKLKAPASQTPSEPEPAAAAEKESAKTFAQTDKKNDREPEITGPESVPQPAGARIYLEPQEAVVHEIGEQFVVYVKVADVENLFGAPFHLHYKRDIVNVVKVEEGGFFKQNGYSTSFLYSNDKSRGRTFIGLTRLGKTKGADGDGNLVKITFESVGWGDSDLTISNDVLVDPRLNQISVNKSGGVVRVVRP